MGLLLPLFLVALQASTIELSPGRDPSDPLHSAYVFVDGTADLDLRQVRERPEQFVRNVSGFINPGTTAGVVWIRFDVHNRSDRSGDWVLSLNRALVDPGEIYLVTEDRAWIILPDSTEAYASSYAEFGTLAARFELAPHQSAKLFVRYRGGNWSGLVPTLTTEATLHNQITAEQRVLFALVGGVLALVLYTVVSYALLDRQAVFTYAVAQISLLSFYVHLCGFTTVHLWPDHPHAGRIIAPLTMAISVAAVLQFARHFFATRAMLPRLDRFMRLLMTIIIAAMAMLPMDYLFAEFPRQIPVYIVYLVTLLVWLTVAPLAIHETVTRDRDFWPLAVSWSLMLGMMLSVQLVWIGAIDAMPLQQHLYGVFVGVEAVFMALGVALRVRRMRLRQVDAERQLSSSLVAELEATQRAVRLAEERAWALHDLAEKGRLILATAHDTRQMISSLRHYAAGLKRDASPDRAAAAAPALEQIATNLDEVLETAISGSASGGIGDTVTALERFAPVQIITPLKSIYAGVAAEKRIDLRFRSTGRSLVSDRVLVSRIVSNLLSNALKYTDRGGRILVACRAQADCHRFQVFDTGHGMQPQALENLLDARAGAVRLEPGAEGHGAGLHIAKGLAARVGGTIDAMSSVGRGSMFELRLPAHWRRPDAVQPMRIVVLDSEGQFPAALGEQMAGWGIDMMYTQAVERAAELFCEGIPLLVDEHRGGIHGGSALAMQLARESPGTPLAIMTYDRSIDTRMLIGEACSLIVYKPLSAELLLAAAARLSHRLEPETGSEAGGFHGAGHP